MIIDTRVLMCTVCGEHTTQLDNSEWKQELGDMACPRCREHFMTELALAKSPTRLEYQPGGIPRYCSYVVSAESIRKLM